MRIPPTRGFDSKCFVERLCQTSNDEERRLTKAPTTAFAPRLKQLSKLGFADDFYAEFFRLIEFASRFGAGEDVVGLFAYAAGDVTTKRFDFLRCFFARH